MVEEPAGSLRFADAEVMQEWHGRPAHVYSATDARARAGMRLAKSPCELRSADFSPQGCWRAEKTLEFCERVCAVLVFLRDESRAPAASMIGR